MDEEKISIDEKTLLEMHDRLAVFMKALPDEQSAALELVLARAASSNASNEVVDGYLRAARDKAYEGLLPVLARSLDGSSSLPSTNKLWTYIAWTHQHKSQF